MPRNGSTTNFKRRRQSTTSGVVAALKAAAAAGETTISITGQTLVNTGKRFAVKGAKNEIETGPDLGQKGNEEVEEAETRATQDPHPPGVARK